MKKPVRWILTGLLAALGHAAISQNVTDGGAKAASAGSKKPDKESTTAKPPAKKDALYTSQNPVKQSAAVKSSAKKAAHTPKQPSKTQRTGAARRKPGTSRAFLALTLLAGIVAGAAATAAACYWWYKRQVPAASEELETETADPDKAARQRANKELRERLQVENPRLQAENEDLREEIAGVKDELQRLRLAAKGAAGATSSPAAPSAPESTPLPPPAPIELTVKPAAPTAAHFYVDAPSLSYLEHRRLGTDQSPLLEVHLTVPDGPAGTRATYEFSPAADQARVIAADVRNLRHFFDFELPLSNQFTRIVTARAGKLERVGDRWEIRDRAQLIIS